MEKISDLPGAMLRDLYLDRVTLLLWCLIFLLIIMTLHGNRRFSRYLLMAFISLSLLWNARSACIRRSSSSLLITHFRGASMLVSQEGERVNHYCWYRDSTSIEYMEAYRESCWNRRAFKNHVYSLGEKTGLSGKVLTCRQLAEGVWMLGGKHYRGLVLTPGLRIQEWDLVYGDTLNNGPVLPDFILLSCEPPVDALLQSALNGEVELVIDGSNRSWYKERIMKEGDRIYLTDSLGAYVKRW
jgi:hypothetical protein